MVVNRGAALLAAALLAIFILGPLVAPFVGRWYECQRLAPIERVFTRGC